ncbi:hypothetical protein UA08_08716 [Talaromyces atroroseus]|uniref:Uncharacterized protein n=1 Tax=Talaromyces atroroseus TaxID=1441469 RepID=A0A225A6A3_TALAT|nr:hypothetical protein UA08_08716 [Talaromyces atroroseus]OKL56031.1 hypothetical protein UA08_08716 [Talaromyces atroroseus]
MAGFVLSLRPDEDAMINGFIAAKRNNPFIKRWHDIYTAMWIGGVTNANGFHKHPLLRHLPLLNPPLSKSNLKLDVTMEPFTDYLAHFVAFERLRKLIDPSDGFDGLEYYHTMSGFRGVMKEGWHPKGKQGGKESWRGDFKGINQVAGWVGKGRDPNAEERSEHVSRPLSSLKDPSSFGPPPKRVGAGAPAGVSPRATPGPPRRGLGAPLAPEEMPQRPDEPEEQEDEAAAAPAPPPLPYRVNRTGISTEGLPPPPVRRTDSPIDSTASSQSRPNLPPRLPARNMTSNSPSPPPPPYSETDSSIQMNQDSVSRLQNAGVSVPELGIGRGDSEQSTTAQRGMSNQVNELQSRFAKMSTPGSQSLQSAPSPDERPSTTAPSAPRTGYDAHNTTASRTAPQPPNNLRQRSNEHIETGKQKLAAFNQKHRITERIHAYFEEQPAEASSQQAQSVAPPPPPHPNLSRQNSNIDVEVLSRRKAPPPPPPAKKSSLKSNPVSNNSSSRSSINDGRTPPPLPLGTKPR